MKDLSHLVGKRIRLTHTGNDTITGKPDPDPIPNGTEGLVLSVCDDMINVKWDIDRHLSVIDGVDRYIVLN